MIFFIIKFILDSVLSQLYDKPKATSSKVTGNGSYFLPCILAENQN